MIYQDLARLKAVRTIIWKNITVFTFGFAEVKRRMENKVFKHF
uniref:Uncharacterized protein n=1 Tax=Rhizophora mucronata TaxID=61149 RepID=A0A2P2QKP8_RHIMU